MAERKRRKPSNKIKPGTPHPTKANVVRGYDGRWVSKKHFETVTKARKGAERIKAEVQAKAKKGGALVKQAKGAVTKATKGGLLKIRKGDRGIVRAIKDTYKLGQDTRKSADAVYRAGKVTRKVHDQLVKGGKEFAKGTVEAGKATRRAYERLKPGGKIVKSKGSKITKYKKPPSKIVRSPGGKVVRSPGGKVVKSPGGKLVSQAKLKIKPKAKTTKGTKPPAQHTGDPWKGSYKDSSKTKSNSKSTQTSTTSKPKSKSTFRSKATNAARTIKKNLTIKNLKNLKGTVGKGVVYGLVQHGANKVVDDTLAGIFKRKGETNAEYQARIEKAKANLGKKRVLKPKTKVTNRRGRVIRKTSKTWKDPYKGPKQPEIKFDDKKTTSKKDIKIKSKKTDKPSGSNTPYWESPRQKQIPEKKKRMGAIEKRNREIFGNKKIDDLKDYHKRWKAARKAGRLKEFKEKEKKKRMNR